MQVGSQALALLHCRSNEQLVLFLFRQAANPCGKLFAAQSNGEWAGSLCCNLDEILVDFEEFDQRIEGTGQFLQAYRHGRLQCIFIKSSILRTAKPAKIQASEVTTKQV